MFYVYELRNLSNSLEYIGCTKNPEGRMYGHIRRGCLTGRNKGKFFGRSDIKMIIVKEFTTKREALLFEGEHKIANGLPWDEFERNSRGGKKSGPIHGKIQGMINAKNGHLKRIAHLGHLGWKKEKINNV